MLPFTQDPFVTVFVDYNLAVWPAQLVACVLGLAAIVALLRPGRHTARIVGSVLGAKWVWAGVVYHGLYFSAINEAAFGFGVLFALQGLLFVEAAITRRLRFVRPGGVVGGLGWALVAYSTVLYPLTAWWTGHAYPAMPMFGITLCPVTLFTFGLLLLSTALCRAGCSCCPLSGRLSEAAQPSCSASCRIGRCCSAASSP